MALSSHIHLFHCHMAFGALIDLLYHVSVIFVNRRIANAAKRSYFLIFQGVYDKIRRRINYGSILDQDFLVRVFNSSIIRKISTGRINPVLFCQILR